MRRFTIIASVVAVVTGMVAAYALFNTDSHQGKITAVTFQTGGIELGDPDEPTYAESIRCNKPPSLAVYSGWPFTVSRGSYQCVQDESRLLVYPIGIGLNVGIAGVVGVMTYVIINRIRRIR